MKKLPILISSLVFFILIAIFFSLGIYLNSQTNKRYQEVDSVTLDIETAKITDAIENDYLDYSNLLLASKSFINASEFVSRLEWSKFVESLNLKENFPSVSKLIYVKRVINNEKSSYVNEVRNDKTLSLEGNPDFQIFPSSNLDSYVVHYLEQTQSAKELFGYDLFSDLSIREAIELSRDTNQITMTQPILLEKSDTNQKSILMFVPIYKTGSEFKTLNQRRENIDSFIVLDFVVDNFINTLINEKVITHIDTIKIDDVTNEVINLIPEKNIFITSNENNSGQEFVKYFRRTFGTRNWLISYKHYHKHFTSFESNYIMWLVFGFGVVIAFFVSYSLQNLFNSRLKAQGIANESTKDLRKFQLAVKNISEQIVITDKEGLVLYANEATEKITGYFMDEILGTKAGKLWGGLMTKEYYENLWKIIKIDKKTYIGEINNKRKNGEEYISEIRISPILDKNGDVEFFVSSERDITNIRKIDQIKTQFISLASHQLRTPLSSMKWNTEMLIKGEIGKLQPEQVDVIRNLYQSTQRMISLVNNLLNVSTIESGKLVIDPKPTNLIVLAQEVIENLKEALNKKNVTLDTNFQTDTDLVNVDSSLIKEVYINLLTNAVKYSNLGGHIMVSIRESEGYIITEVKDNGIGIPLKDQSSIFNKFSRASNVLQTDADGSGLGLYMTKIIVEASNGKIWFESVEGKGTTFWFTLPINQIVEKQGEEKVQLSNVEDEMHSDSF